MPNSNAIAAAWIEALASRSEIPFASKLKAHFAGAEITRLCDCGCNSFECSVKEVGAVEPLCSPGRPGSFFEAAFSAGLEEPIDVVFFADKHGYLSGIDIHYGLSNSGPMPSGVVLGSLLYTMPEATVAL
ncbi:hypothetical protein [Limnobacter sp.]|uniref:hypothetical protein n=1 Tax=Limnobacter sp. TaxID=2003368 RepID=UPI0027BADD1F|nr:hypothetical protein [Limnobacter sp.]